MVEPVQGEGGVHPATHGIHEGLRKFCDENEMLLLIDEVQTGWCRTGAVMSYMNYGIKPDIVSMAKALGGGMPIGASVQLQKLQSIYTGFTWNNIWWTSGKLCSSSCRSKELLDKILQEMQRKLEITSQELEKLPHVKEVRHQGLLVGVEFDDTIGVLK